MRPWSIPSNLIYNFIFFFLNNSSVVSIRSVGRLFTVVASLRGPRCSPQRVHFFPFFLWITGEGGNGAVGWAWPMAWRRYLKATSHTSVNMIILNVAATCTEAVVYNFVGESCQWAIDYKQADGWTGGQCNKILHHQLNLQLGGGTNKALMMDLLISSSSLLLLLTQKKKKKALAPAGLSTINHRRSIDI